MDTTNPNALKSDVISGAIATVVFFLGDSGLLTQLSGQADLFSLSMRDWCFLGAPVAAITLASCHWIIHSGISDALRPALALRRAKLGAWISGALAIGAIFAVYSARAADPLVYAWVESVVQMGLWGLTIGFAIAGGFASSVATIAYEEASLDQSLARNGARLEEYGRHIDVIKGRVKMLTSVSSNGEMAATEGNGLDPAGDKDKYANDTTDETGHRRGPNGRTE